MTNRNLNAVKATPNDELYTRYEDVASEMEHYDFSNKSICCPCDGHKSAFFQYFNFNFDKLKLKELFCSFYDRSNGSYFHRTQGNTGEWQPWDHYGRFQSYDVLEAMQMADVVITNPPFSQFGELFKQIKETSCDYLLVGHLTAISHSYIARELIDGTLHLGATGGISNFIKPNGEVQKFGNIIWLTNLNHSIAPEPLKLTKSYHADPSKYPYYDNLDAIEVGRIEDIPFDFDGLMGVPITIFEHFNPKQFSVVGYRIGDDKRDLRIDGNDKFRRFIIKATTDNLPKGRAYLNGKRLFPKLIVRQW